MTGPTLAFAPVVRPRVSERIASAAQHALTLIIAPAGYGKSVALRHYLAGVPDRHVLFNVRPENATLLGFARGFADALIDVATGARSSVSGAVEKASISQTPGRDLSKWMHAHLRGYTGIVAIDDLHFVQQDDEIRRFLVDLIELTGAGTRWIIASRSPLALPVASWLAYRQMSLPVDELDLRFDFVEARDACDSLNTTVTDEELQEILALTEGWPTALSFALRLSMRLADLRSVKSMTREMTYRYLAEQVFYSFDEPTREFLLFTSLMPSINVRLLASAGYDNATAIIENLRHATSFLYSDPSGIYRYHELFREFLSHQLSLLGNSAVVRMCARVGYAYECYGDMAQALRLYAQGGDSDRILRLLERSGFDLIEQGHADVVEQAAEVVDSHQRLHNPVMLGIAASFESNAGRLERSEKLYRRAIAAAADPSMKIRFALRLSTIMINQSRADAVSFLEPFCAERDMSAAERCEINSLLASALAVNGATQRASGSIRAALKIVDEIDSDDIRARVYQRAGFVAFYCRNAEDAKIRSIEAARLAVSRGLYRLAASAYSVLYSTAFDYGDDTQEMLRYSERLADCAIKAGDLQARQTALQQMLEIETRRGNAERISFLEAQLAHPGMSDAFRFADVVIPIRALRASWEGRFTEAHRLLSGTLERQQGTGDGKLRRAESALFLAVDGQSDAARETIRRFNADSANTTSPTDLRQAQIAALFVALANALLGRNVVAAKEMRAMGRLEHPVLKTLQHAVLVLCRAAKIGVIDREFSDHMVRLRAVEHGGYARMLEAIALKLRKSASSSALTPSEISILQALAKGQTTKDIAVETARSVNTVHAHVRAAISKLRCHGRQEAIAIARYTGLIG